MAFTSMSRSAPDAVTKAHPRAIRAPSATKPVVRHALFREDPAALGAILLPGVTLAVWQRALPHDVARWLAGLDVDAIQDLSFGCEVAALQAEVEDGLIQAGYPVGPYRDWLTRDMAGIGRQLASLLELDELVIRMEVIETDACRKFHSDRVGVRAITTYRGPGTQWLRPEDAAALPTGARIEKLGVQQLATGAVALMKGRLWEQERPLTHRSPPISGTNLSRIVMVMDAPRSEADGQA
jgi:hypothetical protein